MDAETREENESYEYVLRKLSTMLESFANADEDYSKNTELVLEFCSF